MSGTSQSMSRSSVAGSMSGGISLLSVPSKIFNRVILNRIKNAVDPKLRDNQAGFRKNRSCKDQIATLRVIVEQSLEWNTSLYINFIDYEKAFDSVDRNTLWKLLRHYGVPEKIVSLIRKSYDGDVEVGFKWTRKWVEK